MQFSKKPILKNFGELPRGEIPDPLKFNRPFGKYAILTYSFVCTLSIQLCY